MGCSVREHVNEKTGLEEWWRPAAMTPGSIARLHRHLTNADEDTHPPALYPTFHSDGAHHHPGLHDGPVIVWIIRFTSTIVENVYRLTNTCGHHVADVSVRAQGSSAGCWCSSKQVEAGNALKMKD